VLGVSHVMVARVWRRAWLQRHRLERQMLSDGPDFEQKAADVIGFYLILPQHAAVSAADEKTAIRALDRSCPALPLSARREEPHGREYYRERRLSPYVAMNTRTGRILGRTLPRHTNQAFVESSDGIVWSQPRRREIHVIVDNISAHKTQTVAAFLEAHPRVHLHYTPAYSSWLNHGGLWFGKIKRDLQARGIFSAIPAMARKIRRYIACYNEDPRPIRWTCNDPTHRITTHLTQERPLACRTKTR
jgi:hypothetical protein